PAATPISAQTTKDARQPSLAMINEISSGDNPAPAPTPAKINPFASPRSFEGIHSATNRLLAGYTTDSPTPRANRTLMNTKTACGNPEGTKPVSAVKTPHQRVPTARTRRGPKR